MSSRSVFGSTARARAPADARATPVRSAAIKAALVESAQRDRRSLADEAALLAADADDRAAIAKIRQLMDDLRAG